MVTQITEGDLDIVDDTGGRTIGELTVDYGRATPAQLIRRLIETDAIRGQAPDGTTLTYMLAHGDRQLSPDDTLSAAGLTPGAQLRLLTKNVKG